MTEKSTRRRAAERAAEWWDRGSETAREWTREARTKRVICDS